MSGAPLVRLMVLKYFPSVVSSDCEFGLTELCLFCESIRCDVFARILLMVWSNTWIFLFVVRINLLPGVMSGFGV